MGIRLSDQGLRVGSRWYGISAKTLGPMRTNVFFHEAPLGSFLKLPCSGHAGRRLPEDNVLGSMDSMP